MKKFYLKKIIAFKKYNQNIVKMIRMLKCLKTKYSKLIMFALNQINQITYFAILSTSIQLRSALQAVL